MNPEKGTYDPTDYNRVFEAMRHEFGEVWYKSVPGFQWNVWRRHIKTMFFDQNYLIAEMIAAIPEAANKRQWPGGTAFFHRLKDICDVRRVEARRYSAIKVDKGLESIGAMLPVHKSS